MSTGRSLPLRPLGGATCWLRRKHHRANWNWLRRHYLPRWWRTDGEVILLRPASVAVTRY